jgi:hypothetical protein
MKCLLKTGHCLEESRNDVDGPEEHRILICGAKELIYQALAYAVVTIRSLPPQCQEGHDALVLSELLNGLTGNVDDYLENARARFDRGTAVLDDEIP